MKKTIIISGLFLAIPNTAMAYIGPGLGGGLLAVIGGILLTIILGIVAIFWYPIKKIFKKKEPDAIVNEKPEDDSNS